MDELKPHSNQTATPIDSWEDAPRRGKPWSRLAVIFIILGAALFAAGWLSGARGGRVYFENGLQVASFPLETDENTPLDLRLNSADIHSISITTTSRAIRIQPTTDAVPRVTSNTRGVTLSETNGHLSIDTSRLDRINFMNVGFFGVSWQRGSGARALDFNFSPRAIFANAGNAITVYVPSGVQVVEARSTSGSVRINDVSTQALNLRSTSGSVHVEGGVHGDTQLQSTSGRVRASGTFTGNIYARSTSGGVQVEDHNPSHLDTGRIDLQSTSGSVRFETRAPISDFRYELSVSSGSMRLDGNRLDGRSASGGTGSTPINARSTSGGIHLNFSS